MPLAFSLVLNFLFDKSAQLAYQRLKLVQKDKDKKLVNIGELSLPTSANKTSSSYKYQNFDHKKFSPHNFHFHAMIESKAQIMLALKCLVAIIYNCIISSGLKP